MPTDRMWATNGVQVYYRTVKHDCDLTQAKQALKRFQHLGYNYYIVVGQGLESTVLLAENVNFLKDAQSIGEIEARLMREDPITFSGLRASQIQSRIKNRLRSQWDSELSAIPPRYKSLLGLSNSKFKAARYDPQEDREKLLEAGFRAMPCENETEAAPTAESDPEDESLCLVHCN